MNLSFLSGSFCSVAKILNERERHRERLARTDMDVVDPPLEDWLAILKALTTGTNSLAKLTLDDRMYRLALPALPHPAI